MNSIKQLLSLLSICNFLDAQPTTPISLAEGDISSWDRLYQQNDVLKAGNDILKLRLELMELHIEKIGQYFTGIDEKLQSIEDKLQLRSQDESEADSVDVDVEKCDNASIENLELSMSLLTVNHTDDVTAHSSSIVEAKANLSATDNVFMADINGQEILKICSPKDNTSFLCSDISLPTSCAKPNPDFCPENKCFIQNTIFGVKPFWVSCNDTIDGGGWTVIQRRMYGTVDFLRNWTEYKNGFGELDGEFWIGLDKLYALTKGLAPVELYVQLIDFDNVEKYAKYDNFAIGDEGARYILKSLGSYSGTAGDSLGSHKNMKFTTKDQDNDNYSGNCVDIRHGGWWYDNCCESNLNGRYFSIGTHPKKGDRNGISWYAFHEPDYSMKFVQMMIRPRKM